jgi:hypothetical protein
VYIWINVLREMNAEKKILTEEEKKEEIQISGRCQPIKRRR